MKDYHYLLLNFKLYRSILVVEFRIFLWHQKLTYSQHKRKLQVRQTVLMSDRRRIIQQLQEQIRKIDEEIEMFIQDRYLHSSTIRELSKERSEESNNSEEEISELSIEIVSQEDKSRPLKSEKSRKKTKAQERQEGHEKARAWALD